METHVSIYEIYPSSPDVAFRLTNSLTVKGTLDKLSIYRNTLACSNRNNLITVWDFIQNKAVSWEKNAVPRPNGVYDLPEIDQPIYEVILFIDILLLVEFGKLSIWDVPRSLCLPVSDDMEVALIRLLPRSEICIPAPTESFRISSPSQWLSAGQSRLPFFGLCDIPRPDVEGEELDDFNVPMRCYTFKSVPSLPDNPNLQAFDPEQVGVVNSFPISTMSENFLRHIRFVAIRLPSRGRLVTT
jgi:hypothetical protein